VICADHDSPHAARLISRIVRLQLQEPHRVKRIANNEAPNQTV
jgi:hypothetical protein